MICKTLWNFAAVTNNPKSQGFIVTKLYFLHYSLAADQCQLACCFTCLNSLTQAKEEVLIFIMPLSRQKQSSKRAGWKPALTLSASAQMWPISHPFNKLLARGNHMSKAHINVARRCPPLIGGAASHMATGRQKEQLQTM